MDAIRNTLPFQVYIVLNQAADGEDRDTASLIFYGSRNNAHTVELCLPSNASHFPFTYAPSSLLQRILRPNLTLLDTAFAHPRILIILLAFVNASPFLLAPALQLRRWRSVNTRTRFSPTGSESLNMPGSTRSGSEQGIARSPECSSHLGDLSEPMDFHNCPKSGTPSARTRV